MTKDIRTQLNRIEEEQRLQRKLLYEIVEALNTSFGPEQLDEMMARGMAMAEQRLVTSGVRQPPRQERSS